MQSTACEKNQVGKPYTLRGRRKHMPKWKYLLQNLFSTLIICPLEVISIDTHIPVKYIMWFEMYLISIQGSYKVYQYFTNQGYEKMYTCM